LGEVKPAALDGTTGELPGFRQAQTGQLPDSRQNCRYDRRPAMDVELHNVLTGVRAGRCKPKNERRVKNIARFIKQCS
jgi:hypothetical protein